MMKETRTNLLLGALSMLLVAVAQTVEDTERHPSDGWFNNLLHPDWGAIDGILLRKSKAAYSDGSYEPSGKTRPNPLKISEAAFKGSDNLGSLRNRTALLVYFGQQLVEEIVDAQRPGCPREYFNIPVPKNHSYNPHHYDDLEMTFLRARHDQSTGHSPNNPRQQLNEVTPYLDGNLVYGAGKAWEDTLRSFKDGLLLATSSSVKEAFPVKNDVRLPFANPPIPRDHILRPVNRFRRYGNPRTHENPFLTALAVVWFRYHNFVAGIIKDRQPDLNDEQLFLAARKRVIAQYQKIVMYEWLPAWLKIDKHGNTFDLRGSYPYHGNQSKYSGYDPNIHPGITTEFQAAAMRFGHTLVPSVVRLQIVRNNFCLKQTRRVPSKYTNISSAFNDDTTKTINGLRLCNSFWVPEETLERRHGVASAVMGMMYTRSGREDHIIVSDLRENTFGPLEWSRRDLGALNVQRARDHGLPGYNDVREAYGLTRIDKWEHISPDPKAGPIIQKLKSLYGADVPDDLDVFPGGLLETNLDGPGELFREVTLDQFLRIRHGDRFWYENRQNGLFTDQEIAEIEETTFFDVLQSVISTPLGDKRKNVFICSSSTRYAGCHCSDPVVDDQPVHEVCTPLQHFDYFQGSEVWYCFVIILLLVSIIGTSLAMCGMARVRQNRLARAAMEKQNSLPTDLRDNQFLATEWVGRNNENKPTTRKVVLELNGARQKIFVFVYTSSNKREVVRMIDLRKKRHMSDDQRIARMGSSCDCGYRLLILKFPTEIDLVLHFPTQHERTSAEEKIEKFLKDEKIGWISEQLPRKDESVMWREATTVEQRKKRLAKFLKEILAQLGNENTSAHNSKTKDALDQDVLQMKLTRSEFAWALGLQPQSLFVRNMFILADTDQEDTISFDEFKNYFGILYSGTEEQKAEMFFKMFNPSRAGMMKKEDFKRVLKSIYDINDVQSADLDSVVQKFYSMAGKTDQEEMSLGEFTKVFFQQAESMWKKAFMNLELNGERVTRQKSVDKRANKMLRNFRETVRTRKYTMSPIQPRNSISSSDAWNTVTVENSSFFQLQRLVFNYWREIFWLSLYTLVTIGIFLERFHNFLRQREHAGLRRITGLGVPFTRGAASAQMFTYSSLLVTMCRNTLTYLRETFLHRFIPFDRAYDFHMCIAWMAVFFTVMHIVGHMFNFYLISTQPSTDLNCYFREYFRSSDTLASFQYWFFTTLTGITGFFLTLLLVIMVVFAVPFARKNAFKAFAFTHNFSFVIYALLFLHGAGRLVQEPFWFYFFVGPMSLFILDKLVTISRAKVKIPVLRATLLPSDVISLVLKRPQSFKSYQSGQWVRIACPELGDEYHPFTLTSAPHEDILSLHIRAVGPWTNNLRTLFKQKKKEKVHLFLDGPFGESHQDWYRFPVSVLVGGGIGITPFASILKDIAHKFGDPAARSRIPCKKVHFIWVTRTQRSFEWMTDIIQQVEAVDTASGFVQVDVFITQLKERFDLRTAMLYMCEQYFQKIAGVSMFTGLRARTHFGRPNFKGIMKCIISQCQDSLGSQGGQLENEKIQIGVFSCGSPSMTHGVQTACSVVNSSTRGHSLVHHYENF